MKKGRPRWVGATVKPAMMDWRRAAPIGEGKGMERERGFEPPDPFLGKEVLYH